MLGVAGNEIPASSEELTSSAAMAPPWSASARRAPRLLSSRAVRSVSNGPNYIPLRGYVTGPPWTMDAVHGRSAGRSTRTVVDRANPGATGPATWSAAERWEFCTLTPCFKQINPRSNLVQKYLILIMFSSILNPVLLYNSARSPKPLENLVLILLNSFLIQFIHRNAINFVLCITFTF